jgi:hypothetical protein
LSFEDVHPNLFPEEKDVLTPLFDGEEDWGR